MIDTNPAPSLWLDPLSQRVVQLARDEAIRHQPPHGAWARAWDWLTGGHQEPLPLANPRLELLRRFCTMVRLDDSQSGAIERAILDKGLYSAAQLATARGLCQAG